MKNIAILFTACLLALSVQAQQQLPPVKFESTSVVLPAICLFDISGAVPGATLKTGILNSETGLEIKTWTNVSNGIENSYSSSAGTINAITGTIGEFETPDANDVHWEEIASSAGCYQLIVPNASWALTGAKTLTVLVRDVTASDFATRIVMFDMNVADLDDIADTVWDEQCGSPTAGSAREQLCTDIDAILQDTSSTGVVICEDCITDTALATSAITLLITSLLGTTIETAGGTVDLQCTLTTLLAFAAGKQTTSSGTSTFQDPGGNVDRLRGTVTGSDRGPTTITCP